MHRHIVQTSLFPETYPPGDLNMAGMFRRGDLVEVKSAKEILAILDREGRTEALPFMAEMIQYCGHRFTVDKRAEKICDTIKLSGSRRLQNTVMLEDLRCDGSAHDGCQAECRFYWKECWLRRVSKDNHKSPLGIANDGTSALSDLASHFISKVKEIDGRPVKIYMCQATELYNASMPLRAFDPRPYVREFTSGNISLRHFIRGTVHAYKENLYFRFRDIILRKLLKRQYANEIPLPGTRIGPVNENPIAVLPGDYVQVKTREEIASTLTPKGRERGLWFDREMLPFCGGTYRVRQRVSRFISDRNCQMIELKTDCVTLEGVVCSGELSYYRHFCPRAIYPFWRESWLRRVNVDSK
jgi:hypothetical protein